jgi:hypothetical protein
MNIVRFIVEFSSSGLEEGVAFPWPRKVGLLAFGGSHSSSKRRSMSGAQFHLLWVGFAGVGVLAAIS